MNLRQVKQRAEAVQKTKKIVKAMQVVALTRLKKVESKALHGKMYFQRFRDLVYWISKDVGSYNSLLGKGKEGGEIWVVVVGSDRGLCGGFNTNVARGVEGFLSDFSGKRVKLVAVGKKILSLLRRKFPEYVADLFLERMDDRQQQDEFLRRFQEEVVSKFEKGEISECYLLFNEFKGHILGKVVRLKILPVELDESEESKGDEYLPNFIFEPGEEQVVSQIVKGYLSSQLSRAFLESKAAEELSRMLAMKSATEAADKMLSRLMLTYHKVRQATITREIIEITNAQGV